MELAITVTRNSEQGTREQINHMVDIKTRSMLIYVQARYTCLRCAASGQFVSARGAVWAPGVTLIN